jgi:hypothetical protein
MAYTEVPTTDGLYLVDYDLIDRIVHDSAFLGKKNTDAKLIAEKEGWGLPEIYHYRVDYKAARSFAEISRLSFNAFRKVTAFYKNTRSRSSQLPSGSKMEELKEQLFAMEKSGRDATQMLKKKQNEASRKGMQNINDKVDNWGAAVEVAKFTRNASADIILVGSAVVSGGASTLAIGAGGSLMKGAFKYQDTGNIAAGVMEATVSFVTVVIPGPKDGMTKSMARTLIFTKAKTEFIGNTAVGLVEGKSLGEASLSAGVDLTLGAAANKIKGVLIPKDQMSQLLKASYKDIAIPVGLGLMDQSVASIKGRMTAAATKRILAMSLGKKACTGKPGLARIAMSAPVLVDYAILGPDKSSSPRRW